MTECHDGDCSDNWSEDENDDVVPGMMDTMLTSHDFIEDSHRDLVFNIAPGQNSSPLSVFKDKYSEELCFPNIYMGSRRPENKERTVPVYYSDICKSELRHSDRRAAMCVDNLFFKAKKLQMKRVLDQIQIAMRKCKKKGAVLNAGICKDANQLTKYIHQDVAYKVLQAVRGSPPYFQRVSKDLYAMIRSLGPATFFASFSAAETKWNHLLRILGRIVDKTDYTENELDDMSWKEKSRLIQADPVTCARHFDHHVQCLFRLLKVSNVLGEMTDFFYRVEFQHRGR